MCSTGKTAGYAGDCGLFCEAEQGTRTRAGTRPSTLAQCLLRRPGTILPSHSPSASDPISQENPLTGKPDARNGPVRFGGRGGAENSIPTPIDHSAIPSNFFVLHLRGFVAGNLLVEGGGNWYPVPVSHTKEYCLTSQRMSRRRGSRMLHLFMLWWLMAGVWWGGRNRGRGAKSVARRSLPLPMVWRSDRS